MAKQHGNKGKRRTTEEREAMSVARTGAGNAMWGKHQSDFNKQGNSARMAGNQCAVGKVTPHLSELNRSRAGVPLSLSAKEKIGQASHAYWISTSGGRQKAVLSKLNQEWATEHPTKKVAAAKSGHRKCPRISSLEIKVETLLRQANVDFIPQYEYDLGFMDFFIKPNIAVFVNGDYWHNYPDGTDKDKRQLAYLKEHGYRTLVIWEHELKDIEAVKSKLTAFNLRKGTLECTV